MHGLGPGSVLTGAMLQQHTIPGEEHLVGQRLFVTAVLIDGHLGDALLRGFHDPPVHGKAEVFPDGGLDTGPIEDFAFDFRCCQGFAGERFHYQAIPIVAIEMPEDD